MLLLLVAATVDAAGNGLYLAAGIVYLIRGAGYSASYVAGSLLVGGLLGTVTSIMVGYVADRYSPVSIMQLAYSAQTAGMLIIAGDVKGLVLPALLAYLVGQKCTGSLYGALIALVANSDTRVTSRASLRACTNGGLACGALAAGLILATVDYHELWIVPLAKAVTIMFTVLVFEAMKGSVTVRGSSHDDPDSHAAGTRSWTVPRRFLALCLVGGVMQIHFDVQAVLLPLWLLSFPQAVPRWSVGYAFTLNTLIVLAGLRWHAQRMDLTGTRRRAAVASGTAIAIAMPAYLVLSSIHTHVGGMVILTSAVSCHSVGEILHANAFGAASFDLAKEHQQGYYQSIYFSTASGIRAVGPTIMVILISTRNAIEWLAVAAAFVSMGVVGARLIPEHRSPTSVRWQRSPRKSYFERPRRADTAL